MAGNGNDLGVTGASRASTVTHKVRGCLSVHSAGTGQPPQDQSRFSWALGLGVPPLAIGEHLSGGR